MPLLFQFVLTRCPRGLALGFWLVLATAGWGAPKKSSLTLTRIKPAAALQAAAQAAKMNLTGLAAPVAREGLRPGDQITALLMLTEGKKSKQWAIELTADELTEAERNRPLQSTTLFTTSGHEFKYGGGRAALNIRIIGPLDTAEERRKKSEAPAVQERRITVSADYLALGLDRVAEMHARFKALIDREPKLQPAPYGISSTRFPPERLAAEKAKAKTGLIDYTEAEERANGGAGLALHEFFTTAQRTPGLQDVLMSVLDVPWCTLVRSGGKIDINFDNLPIVMSIPSAHWGLPESEKIGVVTYGLELNGKPTLLVVLAVTAPRPPLMVGAGIVGFAASAPDGKGPVLTMDIVSSRVAAAPAE